MGARGTAAGQTGQRPSQQARAPGTAAPSHPVHPVLRPGCQAPVTSEEQGAACWLHAQELLAYSSLF